MAPTRLPVAILERNNALGFLAAMKRVLQKQLGELTQTTDTGMLRLASVARSVETERLEYMLEQLALTQLVVLSSATHETDAAKPFDVSWHHAPPWAKAMTEDAKGLCMLWAEHPLHFRGAWMRQLGDSRSSSAVAGHSLLGRVAAVYRPFVPEQ